MASCWTREAEPAPCGAPEPGLAWHAGVPRVRPTRWRCSGGPVSGGGTRAVRDPYYGPGARPRLRRFRACLLDLRGATKEGKMAKVQLRYAGVSTDRPAFEQLCYLAGALWTKGCRVSLSSSIARHSKDGPRRHISLPVPVPRPSAKQTGPLPALALPTAPTCRQAQDLAPAPETGPE